MLPKRLAAAGPGIAQEPPRDPVARRPCGGKARARRRRRMSCPRRDASIPAGGAAAAGSGRDRRAGVPQACRLVGRAVSTACAWLALGLAGVAAQAQTVTFNGSIGERAALLVIDGQPRTVAVGGVAGGVRLLGVRDGEAEVEVDGRRQRLRIGAPVALGEVSARDGTPAVMLSAGPGGHFTTLGSINGRPVQFMVDTGATTVALGRAEAERIGLAWREGRAVGTRTANGVVAAHELTLRTVRVGEVEVAQVRAIVLPHPMPYVLLGNSFLSRFQMTRENDVMRLERRP